MKLATIIDDRLWLLIGSWMETHHVDEDHLRLERKARKRGYVMITSVGLPLAQTDEEFLDDADRVLNRIDLDDISL